MTNRILLFFTLLIVATGCSTTEEDVIGTYVSKDVVNIEFIRIIYSRGYYDFLTSWPKRDTLILRKDNTFTFGTILCKKGLTKWNGKWSLKEDKVLLDYDNADKEDISFTTGYNQLYNISETVTIKEKKKFKVLCLLDKQ